MRSSKSRSRSKSNRNRSVGNVVNRVFDSSGPEGKVRGTPQQIIDKYNQLTRDANLSNDRVAAENFQQHSEHYLRMLTQALREQAERQQQQQQNQQNRHNSSGQNSGQPSAHPNEARQNQPERQEQQPEMPVKQNTEPKSEVIDLARGGNDDSGLVETPESKPRARRPRRKPEPKTVPASDGSKDSQDAAE